MIFTAIDKFKEFIATGDERSRKAKKNIAFSIFNKGVAILISLAIVPITIDYLNAEQYGIWLTLSSIVAWLSFFDIGLSHGFRNRFAEAKANGDDLLARKYVSTTYFAMIVIFSIVLLIFECINPFINWSSILNISQDYNTILSTVVSIIVIGVCIQFSLNVFPTMLSADQQPAASAMIATGGQCLALIVIYILTQQSSQSMVYIAIALSWIPVLVTLFISIWMFSHQYKSYAPSIIYIDRKLLKNIINLGIKFFFIQVSMIIIFQVINIILSRVLGPLSVTEYNVAYKYFSITQMAFNIITAPYWSAFTDAYTKGEFIWMSNIHKKLTKVYILLFIVNIILLAISPLVYKFWLNDNVKISFIISFSVMVYISVISFSQMYMVLLNGIGKVFIQMVIYICFAILCLPVTNVLCKQFGIPGVMFFFSFVYVIQTVFAKIQLDKVLNKKANGIWNK